MDTIGTGPRYRGVLISEIVLYTKATFGTTESVLIIEVSLFQSVHIREVPIQYTLAIVQLIIIEIHITIIIINYIVSLTFFLLSHLILLSHHLDLSAHQEIDISKQDSNNDNVLIIL